MAVDEKAEEERQGQSLGSAQENENFIDSVITVVPALTSYQEQPFHSLEDVRLVQRNSETQTHIHTKL